MLGQAPVWELVCSDHFFRCPREVGLLGVLQIEPGGADRFDASW